MSDSALQALLAYWQKRLRLQDWDITVRWATPDDFDEPYNGILGHTWQRRALKAAVIRILGPRHRAESDHMNVEETLVHELIHLYTCALNPDTNEPEEVLCNVIAKALVSLRYESLGDTPCAASTTARL